MKSKACSRYLLARGCVTHRSLNMWSSSTKQLLFVLRLHRCSCWWCHRFILHMPESHVSGDVRNVQLNHEFAKTMLAPMRCSPYEAALRVPMSMFCQFTVIYARVRYRHCFDGGSGV